MKHRLFHLLPLACAAATLLLSVSALHAENGLRREVWHSLSAASEESLAKNRAFLGRPLRLTDTPAYYAAPDGADILASAISPPLGGTSFGARLRGYLTAPTTGDYLFWDGGGDTVAVYLSTDENPTGKRLIVAHRGRTADQSADGNEPLKSAPVSLVAGRKYYLEIIHTSDTGQDGLALFWQAPDDVRTTIPATALEPYTPPAPNPAGLTREFFPKLPGSSLADLTSAPDFYRLPAVTEIITSSSFGGFGQNYGVRLRGYLTAPASGDYVFWECGSGDVSVNLATDDSSTALHQSIRLHDRPNRKELAHHKGATEPGEWDKHRTQKSKPITLIAGKRYYLEVLFKAGEGADHLSVAWLTPGGTQPQPLPLSALESYRRAPNDLDDDGMPDALERAAKLDPTDAADASGDLDGDGIFNDEEMRAGANPAVKDSVPGLVVDDIWKDAPGDRLDDRAFQIAYTRPPSVRSTAVAMLIHHGGNAFVRRVRGYVIPPVGGSYTFWAGGTGEYAFSLSTTASKFDRRVLVSSTVSNLGRLGADPSQQSAPVTLVGGRKYYFEIWQKHGKGHAVLQLGWQIPGEARETVASRHLSSYAGEANDVDDDDLPDDWELANGLNAADDGRSPGSEAGAYGDLDRDGLTNLQERAFGTNANVADTDGDGVSDGDEVLIGSNPHFGDAGGFTAILRGEAYAASFGAWEKRDGRAWQTGRRGSVTYPITVPRSGVHALKFTVSSRAGGDVNEAYDFRISLNGVPISNQTGYIIENGHTVLAVLTPWLNTGETYACEIFVDNSYNYRRVSVDQVDILAAGGSDANGNGIPDWVETRLRDNNGFDQRIIYSRTSPATVEGKTRFLELTKTGGLALNKAPNGRFFAEVPLTPGAPVNLEFAFENAGLTQTAKVHWQPTNLRRQENEPLTVRQGDSLLLTAYRNDEHPEQESYTLDVNGQTVTATGDLSTPVAFPAAGIQAVELSHRSPDGAVFTRRYTVNVLPRVALETPLCVIGSPRLWTPSPLPDGAELQFDGNVTVSQEPTANTYTLATATPQNQPLIVRYGAVGPILGTGEVKSICVRSDDYTGYTCEGFADGLLRMWLPVVLTGDLHGVEIRCDVKIGGVTFLDGSTSNSLRGADFGAEGVAGFTFLKAASAHSACHQISFWQNGVPIAKWN
jgi:hypothetical protein